MPRWRKHWLALGFVLLAGVSALALILMATGRLRVGSELPGLMIGLSILVIGLLAIRR
jgi:hypothetical protein